MTDPFNHHARGAMTDQRKARIFAACKGKCSLCGRVIRAGDRWRAEHLRALENGGTDDDSNIGVSCEWCWPKKDAADHKQAGHQRRTYTKHFIPESERQKSALSKRPGYKFDWKHKRYVRVTEEVSDD